jgi:tetratricopeptide (TPR) repeat protein
MHPADREIYRPVIGFYLQTGRPEVAESLLKTAQASSPSDPSPSLVLVDLLTRQNRMVETRNMLVQLKEKFPKSLPVSKKLALVFVRTDQDLARKEIDQILQAQKNDPEGLILLGQLQFFSGKLDEAEQTFQNDVLKNSSYPEPHFFLGSIAAMRGRTDQQQIEYRTALERNGNYIPARLGLAEIYLNQGKLTDAEQEVTRLAQIDPNLLGVFLLRVNIQIQKKNYSDAEKGLGALMAEYSESALVHQTAGRYYQSRAQTAKAEEHYRKAFELDANCADCLNELVRLQLKEGQPQRALAVLDSVAQDQRKAFHYELRAEVFSQSGKISDAESSYRQAIRLEPKKPAAYLFLKDNYLRMQRPDAALNVLDELLMNVPNHAVAHAMKASIYKLQGNLVEAKNSYLLALEQDPQLAAAANNLAYLLAEQPDETVLALKWARTARELEPQNPSYADTLGWIYYKRGEYVLALDQLRFASQQAPDNATTLYHLGMTQLKRNQIQEARTNLRRALNGKLSAEERKLAEEAMKQPVG